jgi:adenine-specific DNA methylase
VLRKESGRFVFTFHHWNPRGWAALTLALKRAGFALVNRYVVYSENPTSVHIAGMKALTHDAILVLAPVEAGVRGEWPRPLHVDHSASEPFCRDCATLLGWLLNADLPAGEIERIWQETLT